MKWPKRKFSWKRNQNLSEGLAQEMLTGGEMSIFEGSKIKQLAKEYVDLAIESMCEGLLTRETGEYAIGSTVQEEIQKRTIELLERVQEAGPDVAAKFRKAAMERLLAGRSSDAVPVLKKMASRFGTATTSGVPRKLRDEPLSGPPIEIYKLLLRESRQLNS